MERWERRMVLLLQRREAAAVRRPRAAAVAAAATVTADPQDAPPSPSWEGDSSSGTLWPGTTASAEGLTSLASLTSTSSGLAAVDPEEECANTYKDFVVPLREKYCNFTWDKVLCWPPTPVHETYRQYCPKIHPDVDPTKLVSKRCGVGGRWEGNVSLPQGYTDYSVCFPDELKNLIKQVSGPSSKEKLDIATKTRTLEMVGLSVSLAALLVSLAIFFHFRSLRNNRTRIHKNLFIAMLMQVVIRLTLYIDKGVQVGPTPRQGFVHNTPVLCEASYVLMEYARTAMFLWMFIEGLYLHNMVTVTVFQETFYYSLYTLIGWGVPVVMTTCWAVTTVLQLEEACIRNYNLRVYFWILEGPRLGVIVLNFLFLLNIIRVLVVKLRQSRTSEMEQVRKAVRAALVLLPLLGITNLTNMMPPPLTGEAWELAIWFYVTQFLTSFQGLFIACLYCFLNGEVRLAVMQRVYRYLSLRPHHFQPRRNSAFSGVYVTADPLPRHYTVELDVGAPLAPLTPLTPLAQLQPPQHRSDGGSVSSPTGVASGAGARDGRRTSSRATTSSWSLLCCRDSRPVREPAPEDPDGAPAETRV